MSGSEADARQVIRLARGSFAAYCPQCAAAMDLLAAPWCGCDGPQPSKLCPTCEQCACDHPDYTSAICWSEAPPLLRHFGFSRFFTVYESGAARPRAVRRRA